MEEKKCYLYGAEIAIAIEDEGVDWERIAARMFDDLMITVRESCLEREGKIIGYDVAHEQGKVEIKVMSGSEETIKEITCLFEKMLGITPHYHKFNISPPHHSEDKN